MLGAILVSLVIAMVLYVINMWTTKRYNDTAVIQQIRTLNRWETASYTVEQIIDNGNNGNVFQQFLFGNRILLIAHGNVIAGFDLANLPTSSINTSGKSVTISLPAPIILSTSLDESQTRIYDRQKGVLVPSNDNLEAESRQTAVTKIRAAACTGGVLNTASENAKKQLTVMLQSLGYTTITVTIPAGKC